jgi:hypothetical protein
MIQIIKKLTLCLLIVLLVLQTPAFCIKKKHRKVKQQPQIITQAAPVTQDTQTQTLKKTDFKKNYLDLAVGTYVGVGAIFTWNLYDLVGLHGVCPRSWSLFVLHAESSCHTRGTPLA